MGQGGAYLQPGKRERRRERGRKRERGTGKKGHEKEGDGSEASSTILGYSLPVSWGPCCTSTILFLFLFFSVLVPARTSCLSTSISLFSSFRPRPIRRFFLSFYRTPVVHLFRYVPPISLSLFLSPSVSSFVGQPPSRRSSCSSGSSAPSLRLFSLVPSACPSRLLYKVIMYRIRYHLIAILGIEKSLVVTVPNTISTSGARTFTTFFFNEDICLTILRNVCSTLSRILTSEEFTLEIRDEKRSIRRKSKCIRGKREMEKKNEKK